MTYWIILYALIICEGGGGGLLPPSPRYFQVLNNPGVCKIKIIMEPAYHKDPRVVHRMQYLSFNFIL